MNKIPCRKIKTKNYFTFVGEANSGINFLDLVITRGVPINVKVIDVN